MKSSDFPTEIEIEAERARTQFEVRSGVWAIAEKYDVPSLRYTIASSLVRSFNYYHHDRPRFIEQEFLVNFPAVYELIHGALHESSAMDELETEMVKLLFVLKLQKYNAETRTGVSIVAGGENEASDKVSEAMAEFQTKIARYMDKNGSFARKYAQGMESMTNKALKHYKWSKSKLDDLWSVLKQA